MARSRTGQSAEASDLRLFVSEALQELEEPYRSTLVARYLEGRTPGEIAARAVTDARVESSVKTTKSATKAAEASTAANPTAAGGRVFGVGMPLRG